MCGTFKKAPRRTAGGLLVLPPDQQPGGLVVLVTQEAVPQNANGTKP